jgi:hypothetical protein
MRPTGNSDATDPLVFWRSEIRRIAEKCGSPVKAAIRIERWINELDFEALEYGRLEAHHNYWTEISNWCGRVSIELHTLDPERRWSRAAWTRLFNVFGEVRMRIHVAWSERSRFPPGSQKKSK